MQNIYTQKGGLTPEGNSKNLNENGCTKVITNFIINAKPLLPFLQAELSRSLLFDQAEEVIIRVIAAIERSQQIWSVFPAKSIFKMLQFSTQCQT